MEHIANLHIEMLPEGVYLATSEDVPGLVAQGRTIVETIEIARDIAKQLILIEEQDHSPVQLTDNQLAEVRRRRSDTDARLLALEELDQRLRRFGL